MKRKKRRTVIVEWSKKRKEWIIKIDGGYFDSCLNRTHAINAAVECCKVDWLYHDIPSEILIRNKRTGEFSKDKRTYGKDDPKVKG